MTTKETLDTLKKKQDEEFKEIENKYYSKTVQPENYLSSEQLFDIKNFNNKFRSETAEAVAREMVGDSRLSAMEGVEEYVIMNYGYNERIAEEQAKRDEIINSLKE